ncbi:unnamed protein product [Cladocopium goreaui]|uniref:CCHC-type domain-containing protein n=1 Tax=Cladocopium goreaui TaxID=2562237 RepID=A0A9P1C8M1_9DINO|nr:unnamed protein product [Cladocopium goreaui]
MAITAAETTQLGVSNQLASLVPTFDPSRDDLVTYQQKVELVTAAWPKSKLTELTTRLILNTTGSAFQKLQLHQAELLTGEESAIKKLIELLGGQWGRVPLAKKYEEAEIALFHTQQHGDETNDSYLARADVNWSKLLAQKTTLADLQAFITLRGSSLTAEDKKKIILESESEGQLTTKRVAESIRMLGSVFFNDITGTKRTVKSKVYDQTTLVAEASQDGDDPDPTFLAEDQMQEDEVLELLLQEGDSDALLVHDFESALSETVQEDPELASAYSAYQVARHKLNEKARNRGFFPSRPFQPSQSKGKGYGARSSFKGKGFSSFRPKRSLQDRILSSNCRACGQKGHWKAECPLRQNSQNPGSSSSQAPTGTVVTDANTETADSLPLEFLQLHKTCETSIDEDVALNEEDAPPSIMSSRHVQSVPGLHKDVRPTCPDSVRNHKEMHSQAKNDRILINMRRFTLAWPKKDRPPIGRIHPVLNQAAMSLSLRLKGIQSKAEPSPNDVAHLTLQDLENETVDFGKKNCGRSYQEIWNTDQEWVTFMVDRYGKSHNPSHRKFIRFMELMVQHHEENQMPVVVHQGQGYVGSSGHADGPSSAKTMAKPKTKAKVGAAPNTGLMESIHFPSLEEDQLEETEMYNSMTMVAAPVSQDPEFMAMRDRLMNLENALTKVVNHLET